MKVRNSVRQRIIPYAHLFRLSHWILAAGMFFLILSGYGIHSISMPSWSMLDNYPSLYPTLRTIYWHKIAGMLFAPVSIIALVLFLPKIRGFHASSLRKITNLFLVISGVVCTITSIGLIYTNVPAPIYHTCRFLHALCGMLVAPVSLLAHIFLALFKYFRLLVPSFAPIRQSRWVHIVWLVLGFILSWCLFTRYIPHHAGLNVLTAQMVNETISRADQIDRLPWNTAVPFDIKLNNGVGFNFGVTQASLRALYNEEYVYMKIQWKDSTYNRIYRPWIKTDEGWMHLNPGGSDEKIYNEDKLALVFPIRKNTEFRRYGCSIFCHNNENNGFGKHWTAPDSIVDVWHWKSVRTDPMGYVDDKYWLGTGEITAESEGRHGDPGESGYANNLVEGISNPIMLPNDLDSIMLGALIQSRAGIYTKTAADKIPVGSAIPGVIISETQGDRADIRCRSSYREGIWTVRIIRKLDTGSPYDVIFKPGEAYDFAMAAFDHSSFRHAYNHQTYRLIFEK